MLDETEQDEMQTELTFIIWNPNFFLDFNSVNLTIAMHIFALNAKKKN